jgi:hypothetical protein
VTDVEDAGSAKGSEGYFIAMPISVPGEPSSVDGMIMSPSPWGVPLVVGMAGQSGTPSEPTRWLALEQAIPWVRPNAPLSKAILEWAHVQRFAADCRAATGSEAFAAIEPNPNDPPDFFATLLDGQRIGVELAAFAIEERRSAEALFRNLRDKLVLQHRHRTGHLTGCTVIVWYGKDQNPNTRPHRKTDDAAVEELIEALVAYRPDIAALRMQVSAGMPLQMPPLGTETISADATFYAVPFLNAIPTGPFVSITGYNIVLAYTTVHTTASVAATLQRLVREHDKDGVDTLLITSGAPDRYGAMYPLEQVTADFYLQHPAVLHTNHISRIILHRWATGDAYDISVNPPKQLWPPVYQGHVPAHQLFVVGERSAQADAGSAPGSASDPDLLDAN